MRCSTIKARIESVYKPEKNEKMSDAKSLHILDRLPVLAQYFKCYSEGKSKMEAQEIASFGSLYSSLWIGQMANEFVGTTARRQVTEHTEVDGVVQSKRVRKTVEKPQFQFAKFCMGTNRRVQSIMYDQKIRARATIWLRLNTKKQKGKASMKAADFLEYLRTELLPGLEINS